MRQGTSGNATGALGSVWVRCGASESVWARLRAPGSSWGAFPSRERLKTFGRAPFPPTHFSCTATCLLSLYLLEARLLFRRGRFGLGDLRIFSDSG